LGKKTIIYLQSIHKIKLQSKEKYDYHFNKIDDLCKMFCFFSNKFYKCIKKAA